MDFNITGDSTHYTHLTHCSLHFKVKIAHADPNLLAKVLDTHRVEQKTYYPSQPGHHLPPATKAKDIYKHLPPTAKAKDIYKHLPPTAKPKVKAAAAAAQGHQQTKPNQYQYQLPPTANHKART